MNPSTISNPRQTCARDAVRTVLRCLIVLALLTFDASAASALDRPVVDPRLAALREDVYRGDRLELQLTRDAARAAFAARPPVGRARALGLSGPDALASTLGGATFTPLFRGEAPPRVGEAAIDLSAFYVVDLPIGVNLEDALGAFAGLPEVARATPIAILPVSATPNDSLWSASWWYEQQPSRYDIHAPEAWDVTTGDTSIVVAVLDTGVLPYHPDLGGVVAGLPGQIWTNWIERGGVAGVDDDGNGFVDDTWGWDFVEAGGGGCAAGEDCFDEDNDPNDYAGHGTGVAGVVGALSNNVIGVTGTAWNVRIMPVRMGWATMSAPFGLVDMTYAAQAIHYAWRNGAHVINASWASLNQGGLAAAADAAVAAGVVVVAAAGNNNQPHQLAVREDVIAVGASTIEDRSWPASNRGEYVDLSAPGVSILTTSTFAPPPGPDSIGYREPAYRALSGTSFAAPMVAGAAALQQAARKAANLRPLGPREMRMRMRETTDPMQEAVLDSFGTGRLNAERVVSDPRGSAVVRTGGFAIGAPILIPTDTGRPRMVSAHSNRALLMLDGQDGDTLWVANLPGPPVGDPAAADLGGGQGLGIFVGTGTASIAGVDASGAALPGWPKFIPGLPLPVFIALGDVDGDASLEVVAHSGAQVYAWHANGQPVAGFPVPTSGPEQRPALADLDGQPGVEIVVGANETIHVIKGDGSALPGWPISFGAPVRSPVIGDVAPFTFPTILFTAGSDLRAYAPNGTERYLPRVLGAAPVADAGLGDFDGDGHDEYVVATLGGVTVLDSLGMPLTLQGWPYNQPMAYSGGVLLGPLGGTGGFDVLAPVQNRNPLALTTGAQPVSGFAPAFRTGLTPTIVDLDMDGHSELLAGTDAGSRMYTFDLRPGSWTGQAPWPTSRGNYARTASRQYAPPLPVLTDPVPDPVTDLVATATGDTTVDFAFTATGENGSSGRPSTFRLHVSTAPIDASNFDMAEIRTLAPARVGAGEVATLRVGGLAPATLYYAAVKVLDAAGQSSAISNVAQSTTSLGPPLSGRAGIALAPRARPSRLPVELLWQGPGGAPSGAQEIRIYDLQGRVIRRFPLPLAPSGIQTWDGRNDQGGLVPAGIYFARLTSGSFHTQARVVLLP